MTIAQDLTSQTIRQKSLNVHGSGPNISGKFMVTIEQINIRFNKLFTTIVYDEHVSTTGKTVSAFDSSASWVDVSRCEIERSYIP